MQRSGSRDSNVIDVAWSRYKGWYREQSGPST